MFQTFLEDRYFIERKYHIPEEPFRAKFRMQYHGYEYDETTGKSDEEILAGLRAMEPELEKLSHPVAKAKVIQYVLENTRIDANEHDYFVGLYSWGRLLADTTVRKWKAEVFEGMPEVDESMKDLKASGAVAIWPDFDHVVPDWDSIMTLGFSGLRERAREYRRRHEEKGTLTDRQKAFFDGIELEYTAILAFVDRLYRYALTKTHAKALRYAQCLKQLRDGAPTNFYEALQLMYLYFMISESVDHYQVRSLGNGLDNTLSPFYFRDLENGTFTRDEMRELLAYFLMQFSAIGNYFGHPFYMGGTDENGQSRINALSHDIIDVYRELGIYNPKIQIKYNDNLPLDFLNKVLDMIRCGQNSVVFCCDSGMMRAVMSYGATYEEARTMDIRGCYETGVRANEVCAATGYVNPLKAVSFVFTDGFDAGIGKQVGAHTGDVSKFTTFEEFYAAFLKQYEHLINTSIRLSDAYEPYMEFINPSSMYSATVVSSLQNARDGYQDGVKYNNSAVLNCGLGTAVDAIMAVRHLVFETRVTTLAELKTALECDWVGYERLRAKALNCKYKYGNGEPLTDCYAAALSSFFCDRVNGRKNARGGVYKAILHSATQFLSQGARTAATPDGRKAGQEISKNASPTPGMDKNGVTALIRSALKLRPSSYPESFNVDVMLHPSAVEGEEGLAVMRSLLEIYRQNDGMSIQFNVFYTETLRDAQQHPEKYRNLQVRVCGWNVLWNDLSKQEQDAYILRAENIV